VDAKVESGDFFVCIHKLTPEGIGMVLLHYNEEHEWISYTNSGSLTTTFIGSHGQLYFHIDIPKSLIDKLLCLVYNLDGEYLRRK